MLVLKNITKNYYLSKTNVVHVLKGVNISFRKNEFVSVLGPSGCGKTTLLNIIGGLDTCDSGEIVVKGVSTSAFSQSDWDNYRNKKIGFVFQSYNLIPHLNVARNVAMPLILAGMKKSEARKKAIEVLETVGLSEQVNKKPLQLSGGQMQRVAIARALITNPDIILADEPTGALDAESSVQVMDLLKKVANDRLVIMVTHNNALADEYSTRIINLAGGVVAGDSNPFTAEEYVPDPLVKPVEETVENDNLLSEKSEPDIKGNIKKKPKKTKKSHLSFATAIELSARTLASKKIRTGLTSFAGSIGIIGIILVLAISTGVNGYISNLEEGALSLYPLTVEKASVSLMSLMEKLTGNTESDREDYPSGDTIYTNKVLGNLLAEFKNMSKENDLVSFKDYLDNNFDNKLGYVKYEYGVPLHVYAQDPKSNETYMKTEPFIDVMENALDNLGLGGTSFIDTVTPYAEMLSAWDEMMDNAELLHSQYDLVGESKWPRNEVYMDENGDMIAEVVVVADEKNQLNDYSLFMLGLKSESDIMEAIINNNESFSSTTYKVSEIVGKEYYILGGYDYFHYDEDKETWIRTDKAEQSTEFVTSNYSVKAKVVGIIRPKKGAAGLTINGAIGYDSSLTRYLIQCAQENAAVKAQLENTTYKENGEFAGAIDILNGTKITSSVSYSERMTEMGLADESRPTAIKIYSNSFESKEKIIEFIKDYNEEYPSKSIKYTDMLNTLMSFVNTMSDAISKVLIGFTSISLIVSSIMIAVIIYTSVLERRKEVGILRSIGARKRDIVVIFMAESGMLGLGSGLLGVFIGWILTLPINALLVATVGIANLAIVKAYHVVVMVLISFLLSVVAGVIPAFLGAKQDPAVALRTE